MSQIYIILEVINGDWHFPQVITAISGIFPFFIMDLIIYCV